MTSAAIILPAVLDLRAAAPLKAALQQRLGSPLEVDASKVERLGGQCLQVLLAAAVAWRSAGADFQVSGASQAFQDDLRLMNAGALLPEAKQDNGSGLPC